MTFYHKWMASSYQRALFKFAAKLGYFRWTALVYACCCGLPLLFIDLGNSSDVKVLALFIGLTLLGAGIGILGLRYFAQPNAGIWVQVDVQYGILAVHMWKRFPSRDALEQVALEAVKLASELGFRTVVLESPLLVKPGRLTLWGAILRRQLSKPNVPLVVVADVAPKRMDFGRALSFVTIRHLMRFDQESKHLPEDPGMTCPTAGFHLQLFPSDQVTACEAAT